MNIESILECLVRIAMKSLYISDQMSLLGFTDNPYFSIFGNAADAIYNLIGEHADPFDDSVTYRTIHQFMFSEHDCVQILLEEFRKNHAHNLNGMCMVSLKPVV